MQIKDLTGNVSATDKANFEKALEACISRFMRPVSKGGNPFLYAWMIEKKHFFAGEETLGKGFRTAATDGRNYYWCPEFVKDMVSDEIQWLLSHETNHIVFQHLSRLRGARHKGLRNIAFDYIANYKIEEFHKSRMDKMEGLFLPLGGTLAKGYYTIAQYCDMLSGKTQGNAGQGKNADQEVRRSGFCFVDPSLTEKDTAEEIYERLEKALRSNPNYSKMEEEVEKLIDAIAAGAGVQSDEHIDGIEGDELFKDILAANERFKAIAPNQGRGLVPNGLEDVLAELENPTLTAAQIIRNVINRRKAGKGNRKDWTRLKRRELAMGIYSPKRVGSKARWIAMIDTSGSMADTDIANGLKELQVLSGFSEGFVVPCDAQVYWDKMTKVTDNTSLQKTKIVGRGGTVFEEFFSSYKKHVPHPDDVDVIMIITDGDCGTIPENMKPRCDLLWIITNEREFQPNFGRVIQLNQGKR